MSYRKPVYVVCDICKKSRAPAGQDELSASAKARKWGWSLILLHYCGITGHVCPRCAAGKTDQELLSLLTGVE